MTLTEFILEILKKKKDQKKVFETDKQVVGKKKKKKHTLCYSRYIIRKVSKRRNKLVHFNTRR